MLSSRDIERVQATLPALMAVKSASTEHFYQRLFSHHPELQPMFSSENLQTGKQQLALFEAIVGYVKHLDDLSVLNGVIDHIVHKHQQAGVQPAHYHIVGVHLIETLRELLGADFTSQTEQAWQRAYQQLATLFIEREQTG
ncbi:globin domain-containing protein [Thalassotalea ponticola]|uniref:globin domain-containing protein n=1 Tax=Thalassotalea ponticola TaxID=1523392 RepID=UPI0025B2BC0B|nr:globin domain-containing protein [Thalassotalea ponticola]MDN3653211.1 globin domain-containing protein [Thalassotalea ponticola]